MSSFIVLSYLIFIFTLGLFSVRESRVQIYLGPFFSARISRANLLYETCLKLLSEVFSVEMNVRLQVLWHTLNDLPSKSREYSHPPSSRSSSSQVLEEGIIWEDPPLLLIRESTPTPPPFVCPSDSFVVRLSFAHLKLVFCVGRRYLHEVMKRWDWGVYF